MTDDSQPPTGAGHDSKGLHSKYTVFRNDGRDVAGEPHHGCFHFVLDIDHDPAALAALRFYAESVKDSRPQLAIDLMAEWAERHFPDRPITNPRYADD